MTAVYQGVARIGRDAEVRQIPSGEPVINLSLAFRRDRKDETGQYPAQWVDAGLWGKRAEALAPFLTKGREVHVTVEDLHVEHFTKADGTAGVKLAGRIGRLDLVGSRQAEEGAQAPAARAPVQQRTTAPAPAAQRRVPPPPTGGFDDMEDDIPF